MDSATVNIQAYSTRASNDKAFIRVSKSTAPVYHLPTYVNGTLGYLPLLLEIKGFLSQDRQLTKPLLVLINYSDGEVVISEPHFHIHASGSNTADALSAFRRIFSSYLDVLTAEENELDSYMLNQLQYLRSYISFTQG